MTKIMINVPTNETSKAEEVEILAKLRDTFGETQSYLKSLFSPNLVQWCHEQIHMDYAPDIFGYMEHNRKEQRRTIEKAKVGIDDLEDDAKELNATVEQLTEDLDNSKQLQVDTETLAQDRLDELNAMRQDRNDANRKVHMLENTVTELEFELITIKAKLYDLLDDEDLYEA